jgi:hypothetical protein
VHIPIPGCEYAAAAGGSGDGTGVRPRVVTVPPLLRALRRAPLSPEPARRPFVRPCRRGVAAAGAPGAPRDAAPTPLGSHLGRDKTLSLARRSVWRPGLPADVEAYVQSCPTCQRVRDDHLPARQGRPPELPPARSGHDFLQVYIDLLTGRVWLVPTFKAATSATATRSFVASNFRDVGLPDFCCRTATRA